MAEGKVAKPKKNTSGNPLNVHLRDLLKGEILADVQSTKQTKSGLLFPEYKKDPTGFSRKVLKHNITPDQERVLNSIRDHTVTIVRSANAVGKTFIAADAITYFYKCFEGAQVWTSAMPEKKLRDLLWGELGRLVAENPGLFLKDKVAIPSLKISRSPLESINGIVIPQAGSPADRKAKLSGMHAPNILIVLDEGDAMPPEVFEALEGVMSGGNAKLLVLFNPRAAAGPLYKMEQDQSANVVELSALTHPNVTTGLSLFPGAVTRQSVVEKINRWTRPLIAGEKVTSDCFMIPSYLLGAVAIKLDGKTETQPLKLELRKPIEPAFSYMVLGRYSALAEDQLISRDSCELALARYKRYVAIYGEVPPTHLRAKMGLDVAEMGGDNNVCTFRYGGFVAPQREWSGVNIVETAGQAVTLYNDFGCEAAYVDSNGLGSGVWPLMRDSGCVTHRIMALEAATITAATDGIILGQFYRMRDQGWWTMREWLKTEEAMLPEGADFKGGLIDQLCSAKYGRMPNGRIKICDNDVMKDQLNGKSPDNATSLMLTFCADNDASSASEVTSHNYLN